MPITVGQGYSTLAGAPEDYSSWALPLTIPVGGGPEGLSVDNVHGQVFVVNSLSVISGTQVVATYPVGLNPCSVGYDPLFDTDFVSDYDGASVSALVA